MRPGGRRRGAVIVLCAALVALSACGDQPSDGPAEEPTVRVDGLDNGGDGSFLTYRSLGPSESTPTEEPVPTQTPTYEPPELDDTQLQANLAALSASDRALVDHHLRARLGEGTWVVVAPMTVDEARTRLFGPEPRPAKRYDFMSATSSAYALLQVGEGVVAWESTGFADPPRRLMAELSRDGAVSAVVTDNIEGMTRFGYARDGRVVFDAFEYAFVDDLAEIPAEVRDLARLAWEDLDGPLVKTADWASVGLAMTEKVTGVRATETVGKADEWYAVSLPWGAAEDD